MNLCKLARLNKASRFLRSLPLDDGKDPAAVALGRKDRVIGWLNGELGSEN
jgi:hypothetical protein